MKVTVVAAGVREEVARYRLPSLITLTRDNHHLLTLVLLSLCWRWPACGGPGRTLGHPSTVWYGRHNARKKNGGKIINKCDIMWHWWLVTLVRRGRVSSRWTAAAHPARPASSVAPGQPYCALLLRYHVRDLPAARTRATHWLTPPPRPLEGKKSCRRHCDLRGGCRPRRGGLK